MNVANFVFMLASNAVVCGFVSIHNISHDVRTEL